MNNRLIVFEGIDGTGKTTLTRQLTQTLIKRGIPAVCFEDFENKKEGFNVIKPFISKTVSVNSSLFFYVASAIHKSELIKKLLEKQWVICDRYIYSTLAYHQAKGADMKLVPVLNRLPVVLPDYYFLLRSKESVRMQRLKSREGSKPEDFQPKTVNSFFGKMDRYFEKHNPIIIDNSSMNVIQTLNHILKVIKA